MGGRALSRAPAPLTFATPEEWNFWLSMRHDKAADVWLRLAKKATGTASIDWEQAVEEAIVWGWTDAQKKPDGPDHMLHRFTPRRAGSAWTAKARATAEKLIAGGWMEDAGLAEVTPEVERYCSWPGQACGYKMGHSEILAQRERAKAALGAKYDLRDFDDAVVTGGNVPLDVARASSVSSSEPEPTPKC